MSKLDGMNNRVDVWNPKTGGILKLAGGRSDLAGAQQLFHDTCRDFPTHEVTLRKGIFVHKERPRTMAWSDVPFTDAEKELARERALKVFGTELARSTKL